jgi:CRISPR-associated Csx10 family RAMP protein
MNLIVRATAQTPIAFRVGSDDGREGTLDYVPGSALWGGLAGAHARRHPNRKEEFAEFFLRGRAVFGNLYPGAFSLPTRQRNPLDDEDSAVRPLPRSARSCKRFSGFRFHADVERDDRHGVWDSLGAWACFALSPAGAFAPLDSLRDCHCGEPRDALSGFCRRGATPDQWGAPLLRKGIFTRTGVSGARGAAAEGILYSREFLQSNSEFLGEWAVDDLIAPALNGFIDEVSGETLRVGHNRTRGMGRLAITTLVETERDSAALIERRAKAFDHALREAAGADARHTFYLPITLSSDCILANSAHRYRLQLDGDAIKEAWGIQSGNLIYCNAYPRRVSGWSSLWGLPKADEWAIGMGSVFLFGLNAEPSWETLAAAQTSGLGGRRSEGFGRFKVADEFHWEANGV